MNQFWLLIFPPPPPPPSRAEGKIKHCRIEQEGRLFVIGNATFESLTKLVDYYQKFPLYRKMKLSLPVNDVALAQYGVRYFPDKWKSNLFESFAESNRNLCIWSCGCRSARSCAGVFVCVEGHLGVFWLFFNSVAQIVHEGVILYLVLIHLIGDC